MWIFEQSKSDYGNKDPVGVMRDIDLATWALSLSDTTRAVHQARAIDLLSQKAYQWAIIRNSIFASKDRVVVNHTPDIIHLKGADAKNEEYHRLMAMREMIIANPHATLKNLDSSISQTFDRLGAKSSDIQTIAQLISKTTDQNFDIEIENIIKRGHLWTIFFLEWCIEKWVCLEKVLEKVKILKQEHARRGTHSFEYWDYHNVLRLAETKLKLAGIEKRQNQKAFVISGWAGNTVASLWVIETHLNSWWSISSISGTSMGWAIAVIVGMIWNDVVKIREFMQDLAEWFEYMGERYHLTKLNLYIPWVPLLAKKFIEKLLLKYGITKDTKFSDLKIPVVINAGRQYKNGEQEILLWWGNNVHDSILASMNVPIPGLSNIWWIWRTPIEWVNMIDYAANERGNPTHWLELMWVKESDMVVVDAWYSSETWREDYGSGTRQRFLRATQRDFFAKERIRQKWGKIININPEPAWEGGGGKMNSERTKRLYEIWRLA